MARSRGFPSTGTINTGFGRLPALGLLFIFEDKTMQTQESKYPHRRCDGDIAQRRGRWPALFILLWIAAPGAVIADMLYDPVYGDNTQRRKKEKGSNLWLTKTLDYVPCSEEKIALPEKKQWMKERRGV